MDRSRIARSALYVPGDDSEKLAKALERGADELIVDLEDAVSPSRKMHAREIVSEWLRGLDADGADIWVRINSGPERDLDIRALAEFSRLRGFVVAKTETAEELRILDRILTGLGSDADLVPLLESAAAILSAQEIASAPRVSRLQIGEADLSADLGVTLGEDEREFLYVRSHVVLASSAAGITPPIGPVSTEFRDLSAFEASTAALRRLGFVGRACIHPAQLAIANDVFTPTEEQVSWAHEVVDALDAAESGVAVDSRGRMLDEAVARQARRILVLAQ